MGTNMLGCRLCKNVQWHKRHCPFNIPSYGGDTPVKEEQRIDIVRNVDSDRKATVCSYCHWTTGHSYRCPQVPQEPSNSASDLLQEAAALIKQRGVERDAEDGERSMKRTVESFNSMTDHKLTEEDGWLFMMMLKLSRSRAGKTQPDDYKDLISYSALLGECALKEVK